MYAVEVKKHMTQRIRENFNKRFKDRIRLVYQDKFPSPSEKRLQQKKILEAFIGVLTGILKREPTQTEILGIKDLSKKKRKKWNNSSS